MSFNTNFEHFARVFKRRRMFRFGAAYALVAWVILQLAEITFPAFDIPDSTMRLLVIGAIIGFPLVLSLAWLLERRDQPRSQAPKVLLNIFLPVIVPNVLLRDH